MDFTKTHLKAILGTGVYALAVKHPFWTNLAFDLLITLAVMLVVLPWRERVRKSSDLASFRDIANEIAAERIQDYKAFTKGQRDFLAAIAAHRYIEAHKKQVSDVRKQEANNQTHEPGTRYHSLAECMLRWSRALAI
jgi:hypothetical protein